MNRGSTDLETDLALPSDNWTHYERAALRELNRLGIAELAGVAFHEFEKDADRWRAWLADSVIFCVRSIRRGEERPALRGLCQIFEYNGRIGGWWGNPSFHDAAIAIQNHLSDKLKGS